MILMARQMKDCGVEWIGSIPNSWNIVKLGAFISRVESGVSVNAGVTPAGDGELGVLKTSCVSTGKFNPDENKAVNKDEVGRVGCPVQAGCLIVSRMNTPELVGACGYVEQSYPNIYLPDRLWQIHVNSGYSAKFAYYYLISSLARSFYASIAVGTSSSMQNISQKEFSSMRCTCPPYVEQEKIATFLDTKCSEIDKVVEQTRATIEEYKKLKQVIITEAVTKGVRGPRRMKPSGVEWIGDIPVGWDTSKAGRFIASTQNGLTRRDLSESSGDIVLKLRNITPEGTIDYSAVTRVKLSDAEKNAYTLEKGDFLFVRVNGSKSLVGKSAIYDGCDEVVAYNDHIIRVRLETNYSRPYFKWFLLSTPGKTEIDMRTSTSAGQFTISGQELRNIRLCVPSEEEQHEIATYLDTKCAEIDRIIEKKEQLIEELGSYKKSLIYEYVTGKKEVKTNMEQKVPYSN